MFSKKLLAITHLSAIKIAPIVILIFQSIL